MPLAEAPWAVDEEEPHPWDFGLTESAEREPHSPGHEEEVPAEGWPEEPCPCGRGRGYKKCHLAQDEAEHANLQGTTQHGSPDEPL